MEEVPSREYKTDRDPTTLIGARFNLYGSDLNGLEEVAQQRGISPGHALRQAIASERLLQQAATEGSQILIRAADGTISELVWSGPGDPTLQTPSRPSLRVIEGGNEPIA